MAVKKMNLELSLVLPGIASERDACVARLVEIIETKTAEKAHVVAENGARLCIHYNPEAISVDRLTELVRVAGAEISERYRHETLRIDGMDCQTCATVIEHSLGRLEGVLEVGASFAAERLRVEHDGEKTSRAPVVARLQALGVRSHRGET